MVFKLQLEQSSSQVSSAKSDPKAEERPGISGRWSDGDSPYSLLCSGVRASWGVYGHGQHCYEVQVLENFSSAHAVYLTNLLGSEAVSSIRVGWSIVNSSGLPPPSSSSSASSPFDVFGLQLGDSPFSFAYSSAGKSLSGL